MQHQDDKTDHSRPSSTAPSAVSISNTSTKQPTRPRRRNQLSPSQLLDGSDICSRFEQVSGKKRTSGNPTARLNDSESP